MSVWIVFAAVILLALIFRNRHRFQDVQHVWNRLQIRRRVLKYMQTNYTILDRFLDSVKAHPHKPFILFEDDIFTYQDVDELSNKAARVFLQSGLVKYGDTVALFLRNEPMFLCLWLGLVKIGCSAAFLNFNIRSKSLLHCFNCSGAKTLVAAEGYRMACPQRCPDDVYKVMQRCWQYNPEERPKFSELQRDLAAIKKK